MTIEQIKKNDHISTLEIHQDLIDTQRETNVYDAELMILRKNPQENRVEIYMREGRILERLSFISKLEELLEYRNKLKRAT